MWPLHHERALSANVHVANFTLLSSRHPQISKTNSVFSNHRVRDMTPLLPLNGLGFLFVKSLYEHTRWGLWLTPWLELPVPFPLPPQLAPLLLICARAAVTTDETVAWNAAESICGGGGGGGGAASLFLRRTCLWGGIILPQVEYDKFLIRVMMRILL